MILPWKQLMGGLCTRLAWRICNCCCTYFLFFLFLRLLLLVSCCISSFPCCSLKALTCFACCISCCVPRAPSFYVKAADGMPLCSLIWQKTQLLPYRVPFVPLPMDTPACSLATSPVFRLQLESTDLLSMPHLLLYSQGTIVLRWERLMGRLCARLAWKKMELLLYWLQLQLSYTEGCTARLQWLSDKVRSSSSSGGQERVARLLRVFD